MNKKATPVGQSKGESSPSKATEKDEAKDKAQSSTLVSQNVEGLVAPSNFPSEIVFYFGSQTGTAEKFATLLEGEAQKIKGIESSKVMDFEDFKPEVFKNHPLIIILVSTHYEGDPCDNTKKAFKWLREERKNPDKEMLKGTKFAVFGLGDTSYEMFNVIGKFFNDGLAELGAERIYKYGEGNAEGNHTEDDFNEWRKNFWQEILDYYSKSQTQE